jgi:hypothetical protein
MKTIYVFKATYDYAGGLRFIVADSKQAAIDKATDPDYMNSNYMQWEFIGTFAEFGKIVSKAKDIEFAHAE